MAACTCFIEIAYMCSCIGMGLSVCPPPRALTSGMIWFDIGRMGIVLQLFSLLLSINWMGVALVAAHRARQAKMSKLAPY